MGIPTLIKTLTASDSASLEFVDGASDVTFDSTYDEYMFVCTDIGPASNNPDFTFQVNATDDAGGGYDTSLITSTTFRTYHTEDGSSADVVYAAAQDQAQAAGYQVIAHYIDYDADGSCAGILHIFSPASTTYVKHFYSRFDAMANDTVNDFFAAGYINDTTAIDEISFKMTSGNFDGVIQMYGIA
jgi:hypothetical protein